MHASDDLKSPGTMPPDQLMLPADEENPPERRRGRKPDRRRAAGRKAWRAPLGKEETATEAASAPSAAWDFDEQVRLAIERFAAALLPVLREKIVGVVREALEAWKDGAEGPASRRSGNVPPARRHPTRKSKPVSGVRHRVLDLVQGKRSATLAELALEIYGQDTPQTRHRIRTIAWGLERAGFLRRADPGTYEAL